MFDLLRSAWADLSCEFVDIAKKWTLPKKKEIDTRTSNMKFTILEEEKMYEPCVNTISKYGDKIDHILHDNLKFYSSIRGGGGGGG